MNSLIPAASLHNPNLSPLDASAGSGSASSSQNTPNNQLDGNSFITLLTAQLQAQDPLNPLDPNQMVSELTEMNTLQQIIQIREDMDAMLQNSQPAPTSGKSPVSNQMDGLAAILPQIPTGRNPSPIPRS